MSDAKVSIRMAVRCCDTAYEQITAQNVADSRAQVTMAIGLLQDFLRITDVVKRREYIRGRYEAAKANGQCCRCSAPAAKNFTMCDKHRKDRLK